MVAQNLQKFVQLTERQIFAIFFFGFFSSFLIKHGLYIVLHIYICIGLIWWNSWSSNDWNSFSGLLIFFSAQIPSKFDRSSRFDDSQVIPRRKLLLASWWIFTPPANCKEGRSGCGLIFQQRVSLVCPENTQSFKSHAPQR